MKDLMISRINSINEELQGAGFKAEYKRVHKNNCELDAYCLVSEDHNCAPTVYYSPEWFNQTDEEVADYLRNMFEEHARSFDTAGIVNRDFVLDYVLPDAVSASNMPALKENGTAFMPFLDMAICFYVPIPDGFGGDPDTFATFKVTDTMLGVLGLDEMTVADAAFKNAAQNTVIETMASMLSGLLGIEGSFDYSMLPMFIVSNKQKLRGAGAIASPAVLEKIASSIGSDDYYILPSSVHELIVLPSSFSDDAECLLSMVKEVNNTQVAPIDRLTDNVYLYTGGQLAAAM